MRSSVLVIASMVALAAAASVSAAPTFTAKPVVVKDGDGCKITFGVSEPTDVEAAIIDAGGKVVRHLAAGSLGKTAPAPLKKDSLSQELAWDGLDDAGKPVSGAGVAPVEGVHGQVEDSPWRDAHATLKVRVALGLNAEFDKVIGWSGQMIDCPRAMAAGPDGMLYVVHGDRFSAHRKSTIISAFRADGQYDHQVMPAPGGLPADKRAGWQMIPLDDSTQVPVAYHVLTRSLYPGGFFGLEEHGYPAVTGDGRLVILSGMATRIESAETKSPDVRDGRRLLILGADGSVPANFLGPKVVDADTPGRGYVAVSPDGKFAYIAGMGSGDAKARPHHVVYRAKLDGAEPAEVFIGKLNESGGGKDRLNDPRGVAVGPEGNIYVADRGNSRIAVFSPAGAYVGEIGADPATQLAVHRKTGAAYAMAGEKVIKYGGLKDPAKKAEAALPLNNKDVARHNFCMALDDTGPDASLWLSGSWWIVHKLVKAVDRGDRFETLADPIAAKIEQPSLPFVTIACAIGDTVIARTPIAPAADVVSYKYNLKTGAYEGEFIPKNEKGEKEKRQAVNFCGGEYTAGKDGRLYTQTGGFMWPAKNSANPGTVRRYDIDGKPVPFEKLGSYFLHKFYYGHERTAGMFITAGGRIFVPGFPGYRGRDQEQRGLSIFTIEPDGTLSERPQVVVGATAGGVAVDRDGSIYLGVNVWKKDQRVPDWAAGKLPANTPLGHPERAYNQAGTIVKFPPAGGRIISDPAGDFIGNAGGYAQPAPTDKAAPVRIENAQWMRRLGFVPINNSREAGCGCESTRFDLDEFGRLFVPDLLRFRVAVLDAAGNEITHFGQYGNMDNRGPKSAKPSPAIAYGWPTSVELAGDRVIVSDLTNRRLAVARMTHAAEAEAAVP